MKFKWLLLLTFLFLSCSFLSIDSNDSVHLKNSTIINPKDYPENNTSIIMGNIAVENIDRPVTIAACSVNSDGKEDHRIIYSILNGTDEFLLYVPDGTYLLYAITDFNHDYVFEDNEISGIYGKPDKIVIAKNEIKNGFLLNIKNEPCSEKFPVKLTIQYTSSSVDSTTYNGQIKKIYSEIFSLENAKTGWWHPSLFMKAFGANIYLTEKYNPGKIPVLFIHGALGSPYDWANLCVHLDANKYQPMFFYYPSGLRLPMLSGLLYIKILDLEKKYRFKKLYIAAHSMGGLISRCMLTDYYKKEDNFIKLYITLATPWSGFEFADAALTSAPYVLPSWIDVSSGSMFIKTTLEKSIPQSVNFYLFYGKYDKTSADKAIDSRVYKDAKGIFGFNADHSNILMDKDVYSRFFKELDEISAKE